MKIHRGLAALALGVLLWGAAPAQAQEGPPDFPPPPTFGDPSMMAPPGFEMMEPDAAEMALMELDDMDGAGPPGAANITAEQKAKIKDIVQKHRREMIRLKGQLALQKFDLGVALSQPNPDSSQVNRLADSVNSTRSAHDMERVHMILDLKGVLTPEQQKHLMRMMMHHGHHGPGHGPGGQWGHGPKPGGGGGWQHHPPGPPGGGGDGGDELDS